MATIIVRTGVGSAHRSVESACLSSTVTLVRTLSALSKVMSGRRRDRDRNTAVLPSLLRGTVLSYCVMAGTTIMRTSQATATLLDVRVEAS